ncbi:receptor-type tyrosine-protein phosphatase H isoform X1 [Oryzias melastigma]|uniref:protein-tyrosine-phosphatase n=1 Tax=Oryzias melastigma TaxID=30732 RepID=A0A3B3CI66_ORYME|nr:receptor-type tyrosine-protein phosphatase H isoform X1 [Oryzias melastigma]
MKLISFKADRLLLCVIFNLLWVVSDGTTTSPTSTGSSLTTTSLMTTPKPKPPDPTNFKSVGQNESSISLEWSKVEDISTYRLEYEGNVRDVSEPDDTTISYTLTGLSSGNRYNITLFSVRDGDQSNGISIIAVTAPTDTELFTNQTQNETSITLTWKRVENISNYILFINGKEKNIPQESKEYIAHVVEDLTSGTRHEFSLFTVFVNVHSRGNNITAVTAPTNAEKFTHLNQTETSITLTWISEKDIFNYILQTNGKEESIPEQSTGSVNHVVPNLTPGTRYQFRLFTVFDGVRSTGDDIIAVTAPNNVETFDHINQNETSITLNWTTKNDFNYTLELDGKQENFTQQSTGSIKHVVRNLINGTEYEFKLFTVFDYARSSGKTLTAVTAPANAADFMNKTQSENSITLTWTPVNKFNYTLIVNGKEKENFTQPSSDLKEYVVGDLTSGTEHEFRLFTVFKYARSSGEDITAVTVPSKLNSVKVTERTENSIIIQWISPNEKWSYEVQINGSDVASSSTSATVTDLLPGTKYVLSVISQFSGFSSAASETITVTKINSTAAKWEVTNSSITATIQGLFSRGTAVPKSQIRESVNAQISGTNVSFSGLIPGETYDISLFYEIDLLQYTDSLTLIPPTLSPQCKHRGGYSVRVFWEEVPGVWTSVKINIAGNDLTVQKSETELQIDQLQPAKTYKGSLVSMSGSRQSERVEFYCSTDPAGVIAGSVIGVLCFFVLVVLVLIFLKKPELIRRKKPFTDGSKQISTKETNISSTKFPDHFHQMSLDENRGFGQEYEDLSPVGRDQARRAALLPDNAPKNRFTNVYPYDWCRVKLNSSGPSETLNYINASYLPGYKNNREYIATQGPLPGTVKDFWRMIWEQKVKRIAMVTNCVEGGRTKCERYWPENGNPGIYGEISVTVRTEKKETNWTLRDFIVKNMKTSEERTVKHFHFTAWPDHGVPESTDVLIQFRGLIRQHIDSDGSNAPTVVHCSAGVGRTGTLIALDVLLQQLDKEKAVGVKYFVKKMRFSRPYMVQTESQYVFLHQCIMDSLMFNTNNDDNFYENVGAVYVNATALRELSQAQDNHKN